MNSELSIIEQREVLTNNDRNNRLRAVGMKEIILFSKLDVIYIIVSGNSLAFLFYLMVNYCQNILIYRVHQVSVC